MDPTKLVVLVDLANFRPRGKAVKVFLENVHFWSRKPDGKTNLKYIDGCLWELEKQTPNSIIISFCDQHIRDSMADEEWMEIRRRSQLSIYEPDKVFLTQSISEATIADAALILVASELESPIISGDRFSDVGYSGLVFEQSFDVKKGVFRFRQIVNGRPVGMELRDWWADRIGNNSHEWLKSDEREEAEYHIRHRIRNRTEDKLYIEPTTQNMIIPAVGVRKDESRKSKRLSKGGQQGVFVPRQDERPIEFAYPETVIYADEWLRLERHQGEVVSLIGRLVDSESGQIVEWIRNYRPIAIIGDLIPVSNGNDRFVVVTGRLEKNGDLFSIHLDSASEVQRMQFRDIVADRPLHLRDEMPLGNLEPEKWRFPSFLPSLNFRQRLRSSHVKPAVVDPVVVPVVDPGPVVDVVVKPAVVDPVVVPVVVVDPDLVVDVVVKPAVVDPVVVVDPVQVLVPVVDVVVDPVQVLVPVVDVVVDPVPVIDVLEKSKVLLGSIAIVGISVLLIVSKFLLF